MTETNDDPSAKPSASPVNTSSDAAASDQATEAIANETSEADAKANADDPGAPSLEAARTASETEQQPKNGTEARPEDKAPGNSLRRAGLVPLLVGCFGALTLMAHKGHVVMGIPLGLIFVLIAVFGALDLLGTFDDLADGPSPSTEVIELRRLTLPAARTGALALAFLALLWVGQQGMVNGWAVGALVTGAFVGLVASAFDLMVAAGPAALDESGSPRALLRRHGFWVITLGAGLYLPSMGVFSLWDPWETHYGEVAREILARDDWISLWWAQDGWFWSKPILNFWVQSLAMGTLGTHFEADGMLRGVVAGAAHPEWVVRMPNVMMTIASMYVLYKGVAKVFGRRAGLLGAIVLATTPYWYFLAHQTMADMPCIAPMTAAMGFLLWGLNTDSEERATNYAVSAFGRVVRVSAFHLALGTVALFALPEILYLISRHVDLSFSGGKVLRFHMDEFMSGSALNCGLPGNEPCRSQVPAMAARAGNGVLRFIVGFEPILQGLVWSICLGSVLYMNRGERRVQRLLYIAAWLCAALATMGKGPMGLVLPGAAAFIYVLATRRFSEFLRLEIWSGLLIVFCVALPWFVAMYVRHGSPFTDRLIIHDMFNRTMNHVHDTNEGDDTSFRFYIWQLGYGLFPWTGLAPLGLTYFARSKDSNERGGAVFLAVWFTFSFFLFSFMGTKFHHYIAPAVPPTAMLVGVALDRWMGRGAALPTSSSGARVVLGAAGVALLMLGAGLLFEGGLFGAIAAKARWPMGAALMTSGVAILLFWMWQAPLPEGEEDRPTFHHAVMNGAGALAGVFVFTLVARDLFYKGDSVDQPGAIRLLQLFTYNYRRPWPVEALDFGAAFRGIAIAGVGLMVLLAIRQARKKAVVLFSAFAILTATWVINVYMVKLSPHWGQHEVIEAYYRDRAGADEQLVAYQMNWKGENFYTSNRIPAFVSSGAPFSTWLKAQRDKGQKVMYFVTEHSRLGGLRSEVGGRSYKELTDKKICNKFVLVKVEL